MPSKIEFPFGTGARCKDDHRDRPYRHAPLAAAALDRPTKVDNRPMFAHVPIWDQGKRGTCTGMALAAGMSVLCGEVLSPCFAFNEAARPFDEWEGEDYDGSSIRGACKGGVAVGDCEYPLWPGELFCETGKAPGADTNALTHRLTSYELLPTPQDMFHAVSEFGFCLITIEVHTGWIRPTGKHRIRYNPRYAKRGFHGAVALGYNEMTGYWLVRNSWSDRWGDRGHAWLKFDDWGANGYDAWAIFREVANAGMDLAR